ncbi:MAG: hypothetical protein JO272_10375 [Pseudonocardiales bacterium]|nr:hypothetical protein [Pseudonocardiales bacterium]
MNIQTALHLSHLSRGPRQIGHRPFEGEVRGAQPIGDCPLPSGYAHAHPAPGTSTAAPGR